MNRKHKYKDKDEYKDNDKDKDTERITESLTVCYIFGILMTQAFQIWWWIPPPVRLSVCQSVRLSVVGLAIRKGHLDFFLSTRFFLISCDKHHLCLQNISPSNLRIRIQSRKHFLFLFLSKYLDVRFSSVYLRWAQLYVSLVISIIFILFIIFYPHSWIVARITIYDDKRSFFVFLLKGRSEVSGCN